MGTNENENTTVQNLWNAAIELLGIYPEDTNILIRRSTCTPMFIAAMSTMAKLWKKPRCPTTEEQIKKMWCVCVCIYVYTHANTHTME